MLIASAYSRFQAPALRNSVLTTIFQRGKPWSTLPGERSFSIASRPFGQDFHDVSGALFDVAVKFHFPGEALAFFRQILLCLRLRLRKSNRFINQDDDIYSQEHLYSDLSDDGDFADCREDFEQNCNKLEREYFETLHVEDVEPNDTYAESPVLYYRKTLTDFEETHFRAYNVTPDRPCSAYFKMDSYMPAVEIFDALHNDGFLPEHIQCLQRKPTGEIFLTFRTKEIRDAFLSKSSFVTRRKSCHR